MSEAPTNAAECPDDTATLWSMMRLYHTLGSFVFGWRYHSGILMFSYNQDPHADFPGGDA